MQQKFTAHIITQVTSYALEEAHESSSPRCQYSNQGDKDEAKGQGQICRGVQTSHNKI